jgi:tRNA(Ile)-lysidine synthase
MPALAAEGLDAARFALFARRAARADAALEAAVADAFGRLMLAQDVSAGLIALDARGFAKLPVEIALRLLGRAIGRVGDEGPVELAKLESLHGALSAWRGKRGKPARFRRTLAGALVTYDPHRLVVARAPARRRAGSNLRPDAGQGTPAAGLRPQLHDNN